MKKSMMALLICVVFVFATAAASFAAMGEGTVKANKGVDITLFGSNRVIPSYYRNFDFDDDAKDAVILTEGGFGAGFFVRNEFRMGWKGVGQDGKWGFKVILENDIHMTKDNCDRNTYVGNGAAPGNGYSSDFGSEFSVERSNFWYKFGDVKYSVGWDIKYLDIKTGGLVYADDHPFMALTGGDKTLNWDLTMMFVNDTDDLNDAISGNAPNDYDWYVYYGKLNYTFCVGDDGKFTVSPFIAFSDMGSAASKDGVDSDALYLGFEGHGSFGIFKPSFEIAYVNGEMNDLYTNPSDPTDIDDVDIESWAAFAGLTLALSPEFNPYVTCTWQQGDDDYGDDDAEGWVGITNIARYTPYGMDGSILYEHFGGAYGGPLYALSNERSTTGQRYGGIGGKGSGNNPGLLFLAAGTKGKIQNVSYHVRVCYLQYDEEKAMEGALAAEHGVINANVDDEIGWTIDGQLKYAFSKNFYTSLTASYFIVGDGIEDYYESYIPDYDDEDAILTALELGWKW